MQDKINCKTYSREALVGAIKNKKVISFDIFDTLIMRKVYANKDIFRLLALQFPQELREAFYKARVRAQEVLCEESYPYVEAIYDEVAKLCPPVKGHEHELIIAEIELEKSMIVPRTDVVSIFDLAKQLGKTVNIVSDMYFHEETMRSILNGLDICGYQGLYVSSEYHTSKPQHLFERYLENYSVSDCLHIGDSWECDILPATKLGIDTYRLKMSTEIYEYEENMIPPTELMARKEVAEYVAVKYNSPFAVPNTIYGCHNAQVHAAVDTLGNPIEIMLTSGNIHDIAVAEKLLSGICLKDSTVLADNAHTRNHHIEPVL